MKRTLFLAGLLSAPVMLAGDTATTPEPATFLLLGAGLAGIGIATWRRNRKR